MSDKFGIVLTDYDHDVYAYLIHEKVVWEWAHQEVAFPSGASSVQVPAPTGYQFEDGTTEATITIGSAANDLLIFAPELEPRGHDKDKDNPAVTYLDNVNSAAQAMKRLFADGVTEDNIAEGDVY